MFSFPFKELLVTGLGKLNISGSGSLDVGHLRVVREDGGTQTESLLACCVECG